MPSTRGEFHLVSFLLSSSGTQRSTPRNNCSLKFIIFPTLNLVNFHEYRIFFTRNEYRRLEAIISNKISQKKKKVSRFCVDYLRTKTIITRSSSSDRRIASKSENEFRISIFYRLSLLQRINFGSRRLNTI